MITASVGLLLALVSTGQPAVERPASTGAGASAISAEPLTKEKLKEGLLAANGGSWREAYAYALTMAEQQGGDAFDVLSENWASLGQATKQQTIKAWMAGYRRSGAPHAKLLALLNLGMTDADAGVQQWAIGSLKQVAFQDFSADIEAYRAWYKASESRPVEEVIDEALGAWVTRLTSREEGARADSAALAREVTMVLQSASMRKRAQKAGLTEAVAAWLLPGTSRTLVDAAVDVIRVMKPQEAYMRTFVLPAATSRQDTHLQARAMELLSGEGWAFEPVMKLLREEFDEGNLSSPTMRAATRTLGEMGNPRAIPLMIGMIEADNQYATVYGIGYFGLGKLTGVSYDKLHDGAWWRDWWEKNKSRFPADVQAMEIPKFEKPGVKVDGQEGARPEQRAPEAPRPAGGGEKAQAAQAEDAELAEAPSQKVLIGGDANKHYELIGPRKGEKAPEGGYRLLVVLPGGDGSADFNPFLRRVALKGLPRGYIVAQAVAPVWRADKNRVVWPTAKLPDEKMAFSTESFVREIIADAKTKLTVDASRVYVMGWSSGGPPAYTCLTMPDMPVAGAFVAMSVFKPEVLPDVAGSKGRACYVLHSPQDFIKMEFPKAAVEKLGGARARVKLETYEGGHGWRGDVFGEIRRGVEWLEKSE